MDALGGTGMHEHFREEARGERRALLDMPSYVLLWATGTVLGLKTDT